MGFIVTCGEMCNLPRSHGNSCLPKCVGLLAAFASIMCGKDGDSKATNI